MDENNQATFADNDKLRRICVDYIDDRATSIFLNNHFIQTDIKTLCTLLESDGLNIEELEVFRAVWRWTVAQCKKQNLPVTKSNKRRFLGEVLGSIRFTLISVQDFFGEVVSSGLLTDKETDVLAAFYNSGQKPLGIYTLRKRTEPFSSVIRFDGIQVGWSDPKGMAISFSVHRPIELVGVCLFGPVERGEFTISYSVMSSKPSKRKIGGESLLMYTDGLPRIFPITFRSNTVHINANEHYKILASIEQPSSGIPTFYGINGRSQIEERTREGSFVFQFANPSSSESETTIQRGQIPKLIFRKI